MITFIDIAIYMEKGTLLSFNTSSGKGINLTPVA